MKSRWNILFTILLFSLTVSLSAQAPNTPAPYDGSPSSFMMDPGQCTNSGWARPYMAGYPNSNSALDEGNVNYTFGTTSYYNEPSHKLMINAQAPMGSPTDPRACMPGGGFLPIFPQAWNSDQFLGQIRYEDTVMRVGCHQGRAHSEKMEYYFIPDTNKPILLVTYECVLEAPNHPWNKNPSVEIQVFQSTNATNTAYQTTPINLGYYPSDYIQNGNANLGTAAPNTDWPYSRYFFIPDGSNGTYPSPNHLTPSRWYTGNSFSVNQCGSGNSAVQHTQYVTVAFNLTDQAINHRAVKFQIIIRGCTQTAHYAYMYFSAKMVGGKIDNDVCGDEPITLRVPYGFDGNTYNWRKGYNADTSVAMSVSNPYMVTIPRNEVMPYYSCTMESQTGVPFTFEAHTTLYDVDTDFEYEELGGDCKHVIKLTDNSVIQTVVPPFQMGTISIPEKRDTLPVQLLEWYQMNGTTPTLLPQGTNQRELTLTYPANQDSTQIRLVVSQETHTAGKYCIDTIDKWIYFDPKFVERPITNDTIKICESSMVDARYMQQIGDSTYTWTAPDQIIDVLFKGATEYGCDSVVRTKLLVERPNVTISSTRDYCEDFSTTLETDKDAATYSFLWGPNGETTPTIEVDRAGTYNVTVVDENDCRAFGTFNIPTCKPFMNLANAISPSSDPGSNHLNDCFTIPQWKLIREVEFYVFTRDGELIYSYKGDPKFLRWCGTYGDTHKHVEYNVVYPYYLKYTDLDGISKIIKSTITVL